jgi:nitrite reductase/ring-hydroxylating ferredoxin subunit
MALVPVTTVDRLPVGGIRMLRAAGRRLALVRTADGVFALDNACPHEGYALTQGEVKGGELTCAWHNWKFRLADGRCVLGEEDVRSYPVTIAGGEVLVDVTDPDPAELRPKLLASLRSAIDNGYVGQTARDVVRLLRAEADPGELVWEAVAWGAPRAEFGWGHALASATDCLAILARYDGDARALPIVQAIAGVAEVERRRPMRPAPEPARTLPADPASELRRLVEDERGDEAEALLRGGIEAGVGAGELRRWLLGAVSDHHLGFGHAAIYTQKAFALLDALGEDRAATVLPCLVPAVVVATREDKLPPMRPFLRALVGADLGALAEVPPADGWEDDGRLRGALVGRDKAAPAVEALRALREGAGVERLLDAVVLAASERLLRYDPSVDFDPATDFGWLDITHSLTYADAARWAWRAEPGPDTLRLALYTVFHVHDSGRSEWRRGAPVETPDVEPATGDLRAEVEAGRPDAAVAVAMGTPVDEAAAALERASLADRAGSFIITAHLIKTAHAAAREAALTGSPLPLAGTARFMASPRLERFVSSSTWRAIDFLSGRGPADLDGEAG